MCIRDSLRKTGKILLTQVRAEAVALLVAGAAGAELAEGQRAPISAEVTDPNFRASPDGVLLSWRLVLELTVAILVICSTALCGRHWWRRGWRVLGWAEGPPAAETADTGIVPDPGLASAWEEAGQSHEVELRRATVAQLLLELRRRGYRPTGATQGPELVGPLADDDRGGQVPPGWDAPPLQANAVVFPEGARPLSLEQLAGPGGDPRPWRGGPAPPPEVPPWDFAREGTPQWDPASFQEDVPWAAPHAPWEATGTDSAGARRLRDRWAAARHSAVGGALGSGHGPG